MRHLVLAAFLGCVFAPAGAAVAGKVAPPAADPNRIINDAWSFLKAREPEMTEAEFALYERVIPMARTQPEFAIKLLETMVSDEQEESPAFEFALANVYHANGRFDLAEARFRKAIERYPDFQRAWTSLGALYYERSMFEQAVECFGRAIALGERDAQTFGLLAYSLYRTGNPLAAELAYMQAMMSDPQNPDWIGAVVNLLLENGEFTRAEPLGRRLVALRPRESGSWHLHAGVLAALGRKPEACATLELAASLGVTDADGLALLGDLYYEQGQLGEAAAVYERLGRLNPSIGAARLLTCVQAAIADGRVAEARRLFEGIAAPAGDGERARYFQVRAQVRLAAGEVRAAREDLSEVLKLEPLHGWALVTLGDSYKDEGDDSRAEVYYAEAARVPDFAYRARLELANACLRARRFAPCVAHLEAALALETSPELQRHLAQVRLLAETP